MNFKEYSRKGNHLICSLHRGSIHDIGVFLQDKRDKPSPGVICVDVKVWDLLKEIINQVRVIFFVAFFINAPVKII